MLKKLITCHWIVTLVVMAISALALGLTSFNLFYLFNANINFIVEHGQMAIDEGGLDQFFQLCFYGILSVIFYIVFKACEKTMVDKILR